MPTPALTIHQSLGVSQERYETFLRAVPAVYIQALEHATNIPELIGKTGNDLGQGFAPLSPQEALLLGIMVWQTHVEALAQTPKRIVKDKKKWVA